MRATEMPLRDSQGGAEGLLKPASTPPCSARPRRFAPKKTREAVGFPDGCAFPAYGNPTGRRQGLGARVPRSKLLRQQSRAVGGPEAGSTSRAFVPERAPLVLDDARGERFADPTLSPPALARGRASEAHQKGSRSQRPGPCHRNFRARTARLNPPRRAAHPRPFGRPQSRKAGIGIESWSGPGYCEPVAL
jgi:hypothetical protein